MPVRTRADVALRLEGIGRHADGVLIGRRGMGGQGLLVGAGEDGTEERDPHWHAAPELRELHESRPGRGQIVAVARTGTVGSCRAFTHPAPSPT